MKVEEKLKAILEFEKAVEPDLYTFEGINILEEEEDYPAEHLAFMRGYLSS